MASDQSPVVPDRLCSFCKSLLRQNNYFDIASDKANTQARPNRGFSVYENRFEYCSDARKFFQSAAENECHLCAILADHIFAHYGDEQAEELIQKLRSGEPKQLHAVAYGLSYQPQQGCRRFDVQIWAHPVGDGEALSVTQVHRHLKSYSSTAGKCRSLLEREDEWPEEANYRWSRSTGSDEAFLLIQKWLDSCTSTHKKCGMSISAMKPTRLLDVEAVGTEDIRMVPGESTKNEPYATLSYCWGPIKPIMLERQNYEEFTSRIMRNRLPKTMQDAITVCRKLSIRYLWIDALCIIQGSDGDFETEAPRMEPVYTGSLFTIAAADSEDSN